MTRPKSFRLSEPVEIQREPGFYVPWEPALYVGRTGDGWHDVKLQGEPRYLDRFANEVDASHPGARATYRLCVPSRRIRAK